MEQYTDNQYDDDLTVGTDEYDDSYYTDADDLFDLGADEESIIGRLKSLILSIDWEITDEVLLQFNEELLDLKDIWAGEKVNLVYIQALQKISKYIYLKKAESHPNAIKLLLTLYHNLEKIVSTPDLSEAEKNSILLKDVKRFEGLKKVIGAKVSRPATPKAEEVVETPEIKESPEKTVETLYSPAEIEELTNLKAIVLGIDWEIRDQDLEELNHEVTRLEELYGDSKARLILLQGIGTLGNYIRLKKSDAHAEAFRVLQFFYGSLEKIVASPMNPAQEKEILFPAVEMFNDFKTQLGSVISPEAAPPTSQEDNDLVEETSTHDTVSTLAPALSAVADDEVIGFQAEEEAKGVDGDNVSQVDSHVEGFFSENQWEEVDPPQVEDQTVAKSVSPSDEGVSFDEAISPIVDKDTALQGVNVEEDDEEVELNEEVAVEGGGLTRQTDADTLSAAEPIAEISDDITPVLAATEDSDTTLDVPEESFLQEGKEAELALSRDKEIPESESSTELMIDKDPGMVESAGDGGGVELLSDAGLDSEEVLAGVDVYSEADDDSEEDPLPVTEGDLAPALAGASDDDFPTEDDLVLPGRGEPQAEEEILNRVDGFFNEFDDSATKYQDIAESEQLTEEPEQEKQSFDKELEPAGLLDEEEVELSSEDENLELEESIEAFFTDTSEPGFQEDELEIEVDTGFPELQEDAPGLLSESDEIEIDVDPLADDSFQSADAEDAVAMEPFDAVVPETIEEKFVPKVPPFKLATPKIKSVGVVEEKAGPSVDPADLTEVRGEKTSAADTIDRVEEAASRESEEEVIFELVEGGEFEAGEPMSTLQLCVNSMKSEPDDELFSAMHNAINRLRQDFEGRPVEQTFVELFATVGQHIEKHRVGSTAQAHTLLSSVYEALKSSEAHETNDKQEKLFLETCKVLSWQQDMLEKAPTDIAGVEENDSDVLVEFDEGFTELEE